MNIETYASTQTWTWIQTAVQDTPLFFTTELHNHNMFRVVMIL